MTYRLLSAIFFFIVSVLAALGKLISLDTLLIVTVLIMIFTDMNKRR